jgi:hypothetical protein
LGEIFYSISICIDQLPGLRGASNRIAGKYLEKSSSEGGKYTSIPCHGFKLQGQTDALGTFDCLNNKRTDLNDAEKEDTDRINGSILCSVMELGFVCGRITLEKEVALEATTGHRRILFVSDLKILCLSFSPFLGYF